ncbi:hypothetical protein IRJ41_021545 [Triplophysa rosa]|uniref:Aspartyl beta-hydroxylase/Triadin domain-containing protein n=1 Tax=Triplophysa rosa TaxID=992332 RepID=A0A9W7X4J8_TRIRA|nr:hypothetical protein IRJ41_021545 [Triplophysa rosa]
MEETSVDGAKMTDSPTVNAAIKSDKKAEKNSIFSWLFVLAMLGVWLSVGVIWFDLVDYDNVVGTLGGLYDADGDGDFDVEDAKVLLELSERPVTSHEKPLEKDSSEELNTQFEATVSSSVSEKEPKSVFSNKELDAESLPVENKESTSPPPPETTPDDKSPREDSRPPDEIHLPPTTQTESESVSTPESASDSESTDEPTADTKAEPDGTVPQSHQFYD